jgi:hypothetical protein
MATSTTRTLLLAASAVLLFWRGVAAHPDSSRFGLRATLEPTRIELTLALPLVCVRMSARFAESMTLVSTLGHCSRCKASGGLRSWS